MQSTPSGLYYKITKTSTGANPTPGQTVAVHYAGKLVNGEEFDNSLKEDNQLIFRSELGR
jgi:peptidyl-prolyl cis-trans isomerase A (cyclophilin A)